MSDCSENPPVVPCIFCALIKSEIPSSRVWEDEQTIAFMDMGQVNPGHVLVAIKRHAPTLLDITPDEAAAVMKTARHVAIAIKSAFDPPGITLLQANGKEGDQTVFHFHMHVVPRHANDGIALSWPQKHPSRVQLAAYAKKIRQSLDDC